MPELPEVEHARTALQRWFRGRRLVGTEAEPKVRTLRGADPKAFRALRGTLEKAERKGKYLLLTFTGGKGLVAHLGMTGKFVRRTQGVAVPWSRARFVLDSGQVIHFRDPRLFGRLEPVPASALWETKAVAALGIDPLVDGLDGEQLAAALRGSRQALKVALMDQGRVAGLGNIHAAEALFRAKLHPGLTVSRLTKADLERLAEAIHAGIRFALEAEAGEEIEYVEEPGAPNPFLVYGRGGEPCRRCGAVIKAFTQAGRTTYFCPGCQRKTKAKEQR